MSKISQQPIEQIKIYNLFELKLEQDQVSKLHSALTLLSLEQRSFKSKDTIFSMNVNEEIVSSVTALGPSDLITETSSDPLDTSLLRSETIEDLVYGKKKLSIQNSKSSTSLSTTSTTISNNNNTNTNNTNTSNNSINKFTNEIISPILQQTPTNITTPMTPNSITSPISSQLDDFYLPRNEEEWTLSRSLRKMGVDLNMRSGSFKWLRAHKIFESNCDRDVTPMMESIGFSVQREVVNVGMHYSFIGGVFVTISDWVEIKGKTSNSQIWNQQKNKNTNRSIRIHYFSQSTKVGAEVIAKLRDKLGLSSKQRLRK